MGLGRSLAEKLQIKRGRRAAVLSAPPELAALVADLGSQVPTEAADVVLLFASDRARLVPALEELTPVMRPDVVLWIAYPKLTSPLRSDLSRDAIHDLVPSHGWSTVAMIAVDADWFAMRLKRIVSTP